MEHHLEQEIWSMIDKAISKIASNLEHGKFGESKEIRSEVWDFKVQAASEYPGNGWIFVNSFLVQPGFVGIMWRKSRVDLATESIEPTMKTVGKSK